MIKDVHMGSPAPRDRHFPEFSRPHFLDGCADFRRPWPNPGSCRGHENDEGKAHIKQYNPVAVNIQGPVQLPQLQPPAPDPNAAPA